METRAHKLSLTDFHSDVSQQWERLNDIEAKIRAMRQEDKEADPSSRGENQKYFSISQLSARQKGKISELYQEERYATFEPSLAELKNLLVLMKYMSSTEHLFHDNVLRQEVHNSEHRLRRTRAGNRLKELIKEAMKQIRNKAEIFVEETEIDKQFDKHLSDVPDIWAKTAKNFVKAKLVNERLIESQLAGKTTVNFNVKYNRLDSYFWNKYQMCSTFVGEELKEKEDRRRTIWAENMQIKHIRALYQLADLAKQKKPEKQPNKFKQIAKEIEAVIHNNLKTADKLLARVYAKRNLQPPDFPETYDLRISQTSQVQNPNTINQNSETKTLPTLRKNKTIHMPAKSTLSEFHKRTSPYKYKPDKVRLTAQMFHFSQHNKPKVENRKMSDKLRKSQFHYKGDKRRSYLTAKMHDYFEEAEKVIESINISEEINNANMMVAIKKLLLSSVQLRLEKAQKMEPQIRQIATEMSQIWANIQAKTQNFSSIFQKVNGNTFKF